MSSGMFRGKESSNRIKISYLVQDLLNFGVLGSLWLWGGAGGWGMSGGICRHVGCPYIHAHTCACTHTCIYVYRNCKWPLTWRHPCLSCLTYMWVCAYMHVCACVCMVHPSTHTHTHPQTNPPTCQPPRGTPRISQNSITLELIKIIQFCLKI